jgi:hypothetical protein
METGGMLKIGIGSGFTIRGAATTNPPFSEETSMQVLRKLVLNLLSRRAMSVLGPAQLAEYVGRFIIRLPSILDAGDLRPLDRAMGASARSLNYGKCHFIFDCRYCDQHIQDGTFAFGAVREIYIRNCYLKFQPPIVWESTGTVLDLGANRGAFSVLMATKANFVIAVDTRLEFKPVIAHNMEINGFRNYAVECSFVGEGGALKNEMSQMPNKGIEDLLSIYRVRGVDLVKMDIEGSEFALFRRDDWLSLVNAVSMEVHSDYGDPLLIISAMKRHNMEYVIADANLNPIANAKCASFIYGWKKQWESFSIGG